jgi:phosphohistidine phosphatase
MHQQPKRFVSVPDLQNIIGIVSQLIIRRLSSLYKPTQQRQKFFICMRHLYLIRHAEAAERLLNQTDAERTLTTKGLRDAQLLGQYLRSFAIDRIFFSNATRTTQTAHQINESLHLPTADLIKTGAMYHADVHTLFELLQSVNKRFIHVAMVGHNPTVSAFASVLCNANVPTLSPAQVVALDFHAATWQEVVLQTGTLKFIYDPGKR